MVKVRKDRSATEPVKEKKPENQLAVEVQEYFRDTLGFKKFTPVQECTIKYFLSNYDCIVQAPTGSGKTLAYILPMMHILKNKCEPFKDTENGKICGLVLVPTRELVNQVATVMAPIIKTLQFKLVALSGNNAVEEKKFKGNCIVVATPGRFANLLKKLAGIKNFLKALEMLIIDEADRFIDVDFKMSTTAILGVLPKQRRTGLFSATQAKELEDLVKFGLRNPVKLEVSGDAKTVVDSETNASQVVAPTTLVNKYVAVDAFHKTLALVQLLKNRPKKKVLIFFSTRFAVLYFERILNLLLGGKRTILNLHGKKFGREKTIKLFSKVKSSVLLATDVAGRGLDLQEVDTVIQFDIPKLSSWYVHRIGRAGRNQKAGESVLILTHEEVAYAEFLKKHEKIELEVSDELDDLQDTEAEAIREKIVALGAKEREFLELGTTSFVAMVNAYLTHNCQIVTKIFDQDIGNLANAYGLLRLPRLKELKRVNVEPFKRTDIETSSIPYKNADLETKRQEKLKAQEGTQKPSFKPGDDKKRRKTKQEDEEEEAMPLQKRKKIKSEWEDLQTGQRLLKKFKKGKIKKEELEAAMDDI